MRLTLALSVLLLLPGALASGQQPEPLSAQPLDLAAIRGVIAEAETNLGALDRLIAGQEDQLDALYAQRDAAAEAGARAQVDQFGAVIDQLNLTLTQLEAERDNMSGLIATLEGQVAVLEGAVQADIPADVKE